MVQAVSREKLLNQTCQRHVLVCAGFECQVLLGFSVANPLGRQKHTMPEGFNALMIEGRETLQQNLQ